MTSPPYLSTAAFNRYTRATMRLQTAACRLIGLDTDRALRLLGVATRRVKWADDRSRRRAG